MNIGIFVDVASMHKNVKMCLDGKLDYAYYLEQVTKECGGGEIIKANAYGSQVDDEATGFIKCLRSIGFEAKFIQARKKVINGNKVVYKSDQIMHIVVDILKMMHRLDIIVIGTSDPIIASFLHYLSENGHKVIVFSCNIPYALKKSCDRYIEITEEYLEQYESTKATQ